MYWRLFKLKICENQSRSTVLHIRLTLLAPPAFPFPIFFPHVCRSHSLYRYAGMGLGSHADGAVVVAAIMGGACAMESRIQGRARLALGCDPLGAADGDGCLPEFPDASVAIGADKRAVDSRVGDRQLS